MASFPDVDLERTFNVMFGADLSADPSTWVRTDLTSRVLPVPINIRRGVVVGAQNTVSTLATVTCTNDDGALTPLLATSPYYPYVDNGTPAELLVRSTIDPIVVDTFTRTASNGWGTSDSGHLWSFTGTASDWSVNGSQARVSMPTLSSTRRALLPVGLPMRDTDTVYDASISAVTTGGSAAVIGVAARYVDSSNHLWCITEFNNTAQVSVRVRTVVGGDFNSFIAATFTSVPYSAGSLVRTRVQIVGDRVRMKVWLPANAEPDAWHIDVRQRAYTAAGRHGLQTLLVTGLTNTLPMVFGVDNVTVSQPKTARVQGYIAGVRPTFTPVGDGTFASTVQIDIAGIGSRAERKDAPPLGPMRRSIEKSDPVPYAYWPCEDDEGSTVAVSAFPGQDPMQVTGPAVFAFAGNVPATQYQSRFGTKPMVSLAAGAKISGTIPATTVQNEWAVSFVAEAFAAGVSPPVSELRLAEWQTPSGTINRWALVNTTAGYQVRAYNDVAGTSTNVITDTTGGFAGGQETFTIEASQNGANIDVGLFYNDNLFGTGSTAGTLAAPTRIIGNPDRANVTASTNPSGLKFIVGHFRVLDDTAPNDLPHYTDTEQGRVVFSGDAWFHESAHGRAKRLCAEERVPFVLRGDPATTGMTILNAQQDGTFTTLTAAAAEAESGALLFEAEFGYAMVPRTTRYNQPAALTVDMSTYAYTDGTSPSEILVPSLDARGPNVVSVKRTDGAERTFAADAAFRDRRGSIAQGYTLDVLTDDDPLQHAAWRVHQSVDGRDANYPSLTVDLAANPALIDAWLGCDIGSRIQRTNQPTIAGRGTIDQVIVGITEVIAPKTWLVTLDAVPAKVWDVGVWDSATSLWGSDLSTLSSSLTTTGLSFTVDGHGDPWVTGAVSLVVQIGTETLSISNISGTGPYTFTVPPGGRSVNGVVAAHSSGDRINLADPADWAL